TGSQARGLLYKNGSYVAEAHGWTANDGDCGTTTSAIPSSWGTGSDYQIKVEDSDGNYGWSAYFTIRSP
ncbi:MAG: hypothetical protein JXA57_18170, partial [Armatimonadetes bacterium]|nr:hypothetical protein [Armatimonadota bacterium]